MKKTLPIITVLLALTLFLVSFSAGASDSEVSRYRFTQLGKSGSTVFPCLFDTKTGDLYRTSQEHDDWDLWLALPK